MLFIWKKSRCLLKKKEKEKKKKGGNIGSCPQVPVDITIEQFEEHFRKLMNKDNINTSDNVNDNLNTENIFEELDVSFTEAEVEK